MQLNLRDKWPKVWREWLRPILVILLITSSLRSAIADWNDVPTGSMKPTILEGDRIFVNKIAYDLKVPFTTVRMAKWGDPDRGEIVILFSPYDGKRLVKRVVGIPGDSIEIRENHLFVNGSQVEYDALDPAIVSEIPADQQPEYTFSLENIRGRKHPVMVTQWKPSLKNFGPVLVPLAHYFVMGDNRDNSFDSRFFGPVEREKIVGRAVGVVASLNPDHYFLPRWHRFFTRLP